MYSLPVQGFPCKMSRGWLGWGAVAVLRDADFTVLFDAGNWGDRPSLLGGLKRCGVSPQEINLIVLSHLHFDHVGNIECFPGTRIAVHSAELEYFRSPERTDIAIPEYQIEHVLATHEITVLSGAEGQLSPNIRWIHTPGHTPGHISLLLENEPSHQSILFAADAVKYRSELASGTQTSGWDLPTAAASIARILREKCLIIPGHDGPLIHDGERVIALSELEETLTLMTDGHEIKIRV
jgi:N-acyl homoserine lactone hydrolase